MRRALQLCYWAVTYYLAFAAFGCGTLCLQFVSFGLLPFARAEGVQRAVQWMTHGLCRLWIVYQRAFRLVQFRFDGFAKLRRPGGLIVVANHPCLMDVTFLLSQLPAVVCVYKAAIRHNLFLAAGARAAGYIPNDEGLDLVRHATTAVAAGKTLLVFPEGTRTRVGVAVNPLKPGFALVAQRAGVPLQLVFIRTRSNALRKDRAWWRLPDLPARYELDVGPQILPDRDETAVALADRVAEVFRREIEPMAGFPAR